jgi:hypothetical protein
MLNTYVPLPMQYMQYPPISTPEVHFMEVEQRAQQMKQWVPPLMLNVLCLPTTAPAQCVEACNESRGELLTCLSDSTLALTCERQSGGRQQGDSSAQ